MKPKKIIYLPKDYFGYFGWPSIARTGYKRLVIVCSGFRYFHTCPFGRVVLMESPNDGKDWSSPCVMIDSLRTDYRDPGVIMYKGQIMVTGFSSDARSRCHEHVFLPKRDRAMYWRGMIYPNVETASSFYNYANRLRNTWLSTPHGPIETFDGGLLYMGRCDDGIGIAEYKEDTFFNSTPPKFTEDGARMLPAAYTKPPDEWVKLSTVPVAKGHKQQYYQEPHIIQTGDKEFLGVIRYQKESSPLGYESEFAMFATRSTNGGKTWSAPKRMFDGSPPHLMRHSRGTIVLAYGQRKSPYGIRVATSDDNGKTWDNERALWLEGVDTDLGYPASVELKNKEILTIFYGKLAKGDKCGILGITWKLDQYE